MKSFFLSLFFLSLSLVVHAQKLEYASLTIPDSLKQNANAVVRLHEVSINIPSQNEMTIKTKVVTTVLNELGLNSLDLSEYHDKNRRITKIEALVYDAFGKELKSYKRKDFKDVSVADGVSIFNDSRALYLDYTPINYPFTIVFETEVETSNTAFIQSWVPLESYLKSVEKTVFTIAFKPELVLKRKEVNFSSQYAIELKETPNSVSYSAKNLLAKKREELSPSFMKIFPVVYFSLENFSLENVDGNATNWKEFGKWYYESLLADTEDIPEETQIKIKQLIGSEKNPVEIAKLIYKYVQEKTRYVSVQVGIGGWKPMLAKEVDKLGYGDCKALTNYTCSLLKVVGVPSYYTLVYADTDNKKDINDEIVSVQGNHAILTLPTDKGLVWLECTSQVQPFGFQGDFTDDRNVLLIKPEGGEIVKTKTFTEIDSNRMLKGSYSISEDGRLKGVVSIVSHGLQYDANFNKIRKSKEDQIKDYKEEFDNINNLSIKKISLNDNPQKVEFTEELEVEAEGYAQNTGGKLMFVLNAFDQNNYVPKKYKTREFPFEIIRGYTDEDEIEISIPEGYIFEAKPNNAELKTEFGEYKIEFVSVNPKTIICKRKLIIKKGFYESAKYESYRKFKETIAKLDNSKTVISKS
jgi:transglutaminase-like putative cysteine protease